MALEAYLTSRAELLSEERSLRRDSTYLANLSATEQRAEAIVRQIRAEEAELIWGREHEGIPHVFPGMEFLTGKKVIEKTRLFDIMKKFCKGALLHVHVDATVDMSLLLKMGLEEPAMHVRTAAQLTPQNLTKYPPEFRPFPMAEWGEGVDMSSPAYIPGAWIPLKEAREMFSLGSQIFDKWILDAMTINPTEAYDTHNTVSKIWKKFMSTFQAIEGIARFTPIWERYIREFFLSSVEDGIMYIEARITFDDHFMFGPDGYKNVPHTQWLEIFDRAINSVKNDLAAQGRSDEFVGARIIYNSIRSMSPEELEWYLDDCINLKQQYPHLIAGFDLVGDENVLFPLIHYIEPLLRFKERQKELGIEIPFLFHAGETLGDGDHVDDNLFDAVLLGTKRIGHGFSLVKHPKLMQLCKERDILLEVCPISNEILRLTSSMPMHPLPILFSNGIPVALSTDDPAIFGHMGLSFDFFQVLVSSEVSGLTTLAVTARDSIKYSTLDSAEKARALGLWEKQWAKFVEYICVKYGSEELPK